MIKNIIDTESNTESNTKSNTESNTESNCTERDTEINIKDSDDDDDGYIAVNPMIEDTHLIDILVHQKKLDDEQNALLNRIYYFMANLQLYDQMEKFYSLIIDILDFSKPDGLKH